MSWPLVAIKEVAKVVTGKTPSTVDEQNFGGNIPFVTPAELGLEAYVTSAPRTLSAKGASAIKLVPKNAVMVCCIGSLGKMAIAGTPVATNQQINSVIFDENRVDAKYGFYALQLLKPKMEAMAPSTTVAIVNKGNFEAMQIPLPPLPEQKRIAAILDKADAIRRKRQQAIQLADEFLRAVFLDMFGDPVTNPKGWEVRAVEEFCEVQGGLQVTRKRAGLPISKPYLRVANVLRNKLDLNEVKEIRLTEAEYDRVKLEVNDILIVEGHGNPEEIGRCAVWSGEVDGIVHQNHLIRVRVASNKVRSRFLGDYINSAGGRIQMMRASNSTSGLNTISTGVVKSTKVVVPPISIQDGYLLIVEKITSYLSKQHEGQRGMEASFSALCQKAFSGQL